MSSQRENTNGIGAIDELVLPKQEHLPRTRAVRSALRSIREAFTEDRLAYLRQDVDSKPAKKPQKTVSVDPYDLLTREIKPYALRNIDDITKEAKIIYSMTSEKKKNWAKVKAKERPRNQFTVLIEQIKVEEEQKLHEADYVKKKTFRERPTTAPQTSHISSHVRDASRPLTSRSDHSRSRSIVFQRGSGRLSDAAPTTRDTLGPMPSEANYHSFEAATTGNLDSPTSSVVSVVSSKASTTMTRQSSVRITPVTRQSNSAIVPISRQSSISIDPISRKSSRQFPLPLLSRNNSVVSGSQGMEESRRGAVEKMRSELQERRVAEMREKEEERQRRAAAKAEEAARTELQTTWLTIVSRMVRVGLLMMRLRQYREEAHAKAQLHMMNVAAKTLQGWWHLKPLELKLKRNPAVAQAICVFITMLWYRRERNKRAAAASLVTKFIHDSINVSLLTRRMYVFRFRIIKIQKWARQWMDVQYARLQLLWHAMEKIERRKIRQMRIEKKKNEKSSLEAMFAMTGFRQTLSEIDSISSGLNKLYERQEKLMQRVLLEQKKEDYEAAVAHIEAEEALKASTLSSFKNASKLPTAGNINTNASANTNAKAPYQYKHLPWIKRMTRSPLNAQRMTILRSILTAQRRRHCYSILELDRRRRIGGAERVDVNELKRFLRDPRSNSNIDNIITLDSGRKKPRELFLLLTKGGLEMIEASSFPR